MSTQAFLRELGAVLGAGYRVVCITTFEEGRAKGILQRAFGSVVLWTVTTGLGGDAATADPLAALDHALAAPGVYVFCDLHAFFSDPKVVRALRDYAQSPFPGRPVRSALILVSPFADLPKEIDRDVATLELPLPDEQEIAALYDAAQLPEALPKDALVRATLGLTQEEALRGFRRAQKLQGDDALACVLREKSRALRRSSTLELISEDVALGDVGGLEVLKGWLKMRVVAFDARAREFGLAEPRGMLVCGVQGCGKSLVSKAAAKVLGLPLVRLDFADVFSAAAPEHALREALRVVTAIAPVVLWVDEIEKGLGNATQGVEVRVFGAFLTWLQERHAPVFVAATANEVEKLPPELARRGRFDEVFFVDLPAAKEREEILTVHFARHGRDPAKLGLATVAKETEQFSGAELEQVVSAALFRAFERKRDITEADVRAAARDVVPLATLYEEKIQALRSWGAQRARRASADWRTLELFEG